MKPGRFRLDLPWPADEEWPKRSGGDGSKKEGLTAVYGLTVTTAEDDLRTRCDQRYPTERGENQPRQIATGFQ